MTLCIFLVLDAVDETHHGMFQCDATSTYNEKQYGPATATIDVDVKCMKDLLMAIIQTFFLIQTNHDSKATKRCMLYPGMISMWSAHSKQTQNQLYPGLMR